MAVQIDYTSKDYEGLRTSLLDHAAVVFPDWTGRNEADFGVMLAEMFAYMGDVLSYYGDRIAGEAYLATATQRRSVLLLAQLLGYTPSNAIAATGTVTFTSSADVVGTTLIPAGTKVMSDFIQKYDSPIFFETVLDVTVPAAGGSIVATVEQGEQQGTRTITINIGTPYEETVLVEELGVSDGSLDQLVAIPNKPVVQGSVRFFTSTVDALGTSTYSEWQEYTNLIDATSQEQAYSLNTDQGGVTYIQLGDGTNGAVVPTGANMFVAYRVGGGVKGNLGANQIIEIVDSFIGITITASSATTGGADAETTEQIRTNAPKAYRTQNRAVTIADYADLALGVAAVYKAAAVGNSYTSITVFIVGPNGSTASQGLKDAVKTYLDSRKMAGTTVTVSNASVIPINIGSVSGPTAPTILGVLPNYRRADVTAEVTNALKDYLSLANVSFGQRISLSDIYRVIASVPGVAYAQIALLARSDAAQSGTSDIQLREWEVPSAGNIVINATGGIG